MSVPVPSVEDVVDLVSRASCRLPSDIVGALEAAAAVSEGPSSCLLREMLVNCRMAEEKSTPICQDTGLPYFLVSGARFDAAGRAAFEAVAVEAVRRCTAAGLLRPNAVMPLTGANFGDGAGPGIPQFCFDDDHSGVPRVDLMLKGGGSENVGCQYSLPDVSIGAGRDLDGVRRCVVDAAFRAQGLGCAPGILGVCIGGDRASGYSFAKRQLLRRLDEKDGDFGPFESSLVNEINALGIGPMGLGGHPTVLAVRVGELARHPASFFVTVSYGCWALRRSSLLLDPDGVRFT